MDFDLKDCGGCRTCQIACSFKISGDFNYHVSGIEILEKDDKSGYFVRLNSKAELNRNICDGCQNIEEPVCVKFCHKSNELQAIINQYRVMLYKD